MKNPVLKFFYHIAMAIYYSIYYSLLWFRHVGYIYLAFLVVLSSIGYGAYSLAIATPLVKISFTIGGIVVYNLAGKFTKSVRFLNYVILVIMPITVYSLILTAFVVPWFITIGILINFVFAIAFAVMEENKVTIPRALAWIRNVINLLIIVYLSYYITTLL